MKCPKCQSENREGAKFCNECAAELVPCCPKCGNLNRPGSKYCDECAHPLMEVKALPVDYSQPQSYTPQHLIDKILTTRSSIEGERKLVTVLFADVANYTSIAEKLDPEAVHQMMDGCFKILMDEIHRYEGTINQFTGDGVMALFGAPVAHEDHAQRACHAALSIQKAIQGYGQKIQNDYCAQFRMRIGLNSGPVIVGSIGDDLRMDYTAVGDTTNLASRMQSMANPGAVLVSGNTHKLACDFFNFESLGKIPVKGKEKPQEAYELIRPSEIETRIEAAAAKGLTKFVGREQELHALRQAFEKAESGSGQIIGIVGEAGVGKSRVLVELKRTLPEGEYNYLEGRCLHYGGSMPYLPILDVLKKYFGIKEEDREATIKKKLKDRLHDLDAEMTEPPPALHEVLSLKVEDEKYLQLGPQQRRERTFEAIRDVLIRESQKKPLILAVEDLHWIDKTSEEFLNYLIGFLPTANILLILLYRPEYTHTWGSKSYYSKIGLDQLSMKTSAELVQAILEGGKVAPEIGGLILGRAGGNPLFVEELTHSLLENGSIQKQDQRFVLTKRPSDIEVPDTIQGIIASRMDRIEDNLKRIMQVASVIGREFAYRILATITGMKEELKASLLNLQGLEFIYEKQLFPELEYIFKHALTQEVAYNSLLLKRRQEIHEKIGQAIEELYSERLEDHCELLVHHYMRSGNRDKAFEYLSMALWKASKAIAVEEAKSYFDQGMKLLDTMPDTEKNRERRISLLVDSNIAFILLMRISEYYELLTRYEPLVGEIDNAPLAGGVYNSLGYCEWFFGSYDSAIQSGKRAAELCELGGDLEAAGLALTVQMSGHLLKGDLERVITLKEEATQRLYNNSNEWFNRAAAQDALMWASLAYSSLGRWNEAVESGEELLRLAQEYPDDGLIAMGARNLCQVYTFKGDLDRAIEYGEMGVKRASTLADKVFLQAALAWAMCRAGELEGNIDRLAEVIQLYRDWQFGSLQVSYTPMLADGYLLAGDYDKARQTAKEAVEVAEQQGAKGILGWASRLLGDIALKTTVDEAPSHFEQAITICKETKMENELAFSYSGMGRYHKHQGNTAQARKYLTNALEIFERLGTLIEPDKVRKELAELPQ